MDPSERTQTDIHTQIKQINKSIRCKKANNGSLLCTTPTPSNSALDFLKSFCSPVSLFHSFFMCFSSLLSWGITGCGGALQCGAEQGGGRGGEGEEDIIGIEWSLMLIPCTQTILWLSWLIPGPGPSRYSSPTVAGISPDKQLKEL